MNKAIVIGIAAAIVIGIGVAVGMSGDYSMTIPEIENTEPTETEEPESSEKKSFKIELEENMSIEGKP